MRLRARHFAGVLILLLFAWLISEAVNIDNSEGSWLLRSLFHPGPRYFELTAELTIDGEPVTITRTIECVPYFYNPFDHPLQPYWRPAREAMTERLGSGQGVVVLVPDYCSQFAQPQPADAPPWGAFPHLPDDYIPLIGLVDNADDPAELTLYVSGTSVTSLSSRVRLIAVYLRNSPDLRPETSPNEFGLWENLTKAGYLENRSKPGTFYAIYAATASREQWQTVPMLRQSLSTLRTPQFLEGEVASVARDSFPATLGIISTIEGELGAARLTAGPAGDRFIAVAPFRRAEDVLTFSGSERGVIVYHRLDQLPEDIRARWPELPLRIGGIDVSNKHLLESQFFLPQEQLLLNISWNTLRFVTPRIEEEVQ